MFTIHAAWQKTFVFRFVIVLLLETTDDVPNSTYIFLPNKIYVIDILANGNTLLIQIQSVVFVYKNTLIISSCLTLSWRRPISYRNQSIDIGLRHERVKLNISFYPPLSFKRTSRIQFG